MTKFLIQDRCDGRDARVAWETNIEVDTEDDNIYLWNVKMFNFGEDSPLDAECAQLQNQFGYDFIELQIGE